MVGVSQFVESIVELKRILSNEIVRRVDTDGAQVISDRRTYIREVC